MAFGRQCCEQNIVEFLPFQACVMFVTQYCYFLFLYTVINQRSRQKKMAQAIATYIALVVFYVCKSFDSILPAINVCGKIPCQKNCQAKQRDMQNDTETFLSAKLKKKLI